MILSYRLKMLLLPRILQAIFALIITGLVGSMISTSGWNAIPSTGGNAAPVNYAIFLGIWTLLLTPFFVWACVRMCPQPRRETPAEQDSREQRTLLFLRISLILDVLSVIFVFSGAVAMSAALGVHSCNNEAYSSTNGITNSSLDTKVRCREAQASTAFLWFLFFAFAASLALGVRDGYHRMYHGDQDAKATKHPAMQMNGDRVQGAVGVEMSERGTAKQARTNPAPTYLYGLGPEAYRAKAGHIGSDENTQISDEYAETESFGGRRHELRNIDVEADPGLSFVTQPEPSATSGGFRFSGALREFRKRTERDEW